MKTVIDSQCAHGWQNPPQDPLSEHCQTPARTGYIFLAHLWLPCPANPAHDALSRNAIWESYDDPEEFHATHSTVTRLYLAHHEQNANNVEEIVRLDP